MQFCHTCNERRERMHEKLVFLNVSAIKYKVALNLVHPTPVQSGICIVLVRLPWSLASFPELHLNSHQSSQTKCLRLMKTSTLHARKTIQPSSATMTSQSHLEPIPVGSSPASRDYRNKCQHNIIHTTIPVPKRGKRIVTIASFFWFFCRPIRRSPKTLLQPPAVNEKEIVNFPIVEVSRTSRVGAIEIESPKKKRFVITSWPPPCWAEAEKHFPFRPDGVFGATRATDEKPEKLDSAAMGRHGQCSRSVATAAVMHWSDVVK